MIKQVKVNGKDVKIGTAYMYGDISILYIDGQNTNVAMWAPTSEKELKDHIIDGVHALYGKDANCIIN